MWQERTGPARILGTRSRTDAWWNARARLPVWEHSLAEDLGFIWVGTAESQQSTSKTRTRWVAEVSSSKECCTIGLKDKFCFNSVLWLRPHLGSPLFNCGYHFSALCSSSKTTSALLNSSHKYSQQLSSSSSLPTSAQVYSPLPISQFFSATLTLHLFSTRLCSSHRLPPLLNSSPPLLTSAPVISPLCQLISTLLASRQLFSPLPTCFHRDALHTASFTHLSFYTVKLFHREAFAQSQFLHRAGFTQRRSYS